MAIAHGEIGLVLKAAAFAAHKHRDQRRKDARATPYINHPIALAEVLHNDGGVSRKLPRQVDSLKLDSPATPPQFRTCPVLTCPVFRRSAGKARSRWTRFAAASVALLGPEALRHTLAGVTFRATNTQKSRQLYRLAH